jgi:hypothetical protein
MTASVAFAGGEHRRNSCEGYKGKLLNRCHEVIHPDFKDAAGIGVDVLVHQIEQGDLVAEYKYDFNNESHSIFGVFKTNKSLVEIVKGFFNRD